MHNRYNITTRDKSLYVYPPHGRAKVIRFARYVVDFEYQFLDIIDVFWGPKAVGIHFVPRLFQKIT